MNKANNGTVWNCGTPEDLRDRIADVNCEYMEREITFNDRDLSEKEVVAIKAECKIFLLDAKSTIMSTPMKYRFEKFLKNVVTVRLYYKVLRTAAGTMARLGIILSAIMIWGVVKEKFDLLIMIICLTFCIVRNFSIWISFLFSIREVIKLFVLLWWQDSYAPIQNKILQAAVLK